MLGGKSLGLHPERSLRVERFTVDVTSALTLTSRSRPGYWSWFYITFHQPRTLICPAPLPCRLSFNRSDLTRGTIHKKKRLPLTSKIQSSKIFGEKQNQFKICHVLIFLFQTIILFKLKLISTKEIIFTLNTKKIPMTIFVHTKSYP